MTNGRVSSLTFRHNVTHFSSSWPVRCGWKRWCRFGQPRPENLALTANHLLLCTYIHTVMRQHARITAVTCPTLAALVSRPNCTSLHLQQLRPSAQVCSCWELAQRRRLSALNRHQIWPTTFEPSRTIASHFTRQSTLAFLMHAACILLQFNHVNLEALPWDDVCHALHSTRSNIAKKRHTGGLPRDLVLGENESSFFSLAN